MMLPSLWKFSRSQWAGWCVLLTGVLYLVALGAGFNLLWPAAISWLSVLLCWNRLSSSARKQSLILLLTGCLLLGWSAWRGVHLDLAQAVSRNLPLLTMFVAVSFLALTNPEEEDKRQPTGVRGFWSTLLACHLLGAVINLSIVFVVGDRLLRKGHLSDEQTRVIMRGFCTGAYWSPFFVAFGVAMTYAPGAAWQHTVLPGIAMGILMMLCTFLEVRRHQIHEFKGYPLQSDSLIIPSILAVAVLALHHVFSSINILSIISIMAPLGAVLFMRQRPRVQVLRHYVEHRLSNVSSQFALFLAAGVFSSGVGACITAYPELFQFSASHFTTGIFLLASAVMIAIGLIGVHPVVSISLVSPFLLPIATNMNQLAFLYLSVWGTATGCSPLSGVGLAMVSRFNVPSKLILKQNLVYMVLMWLAAGGINALVFG